MITLNRLNRHLWYGWQRGVAIACIFNFIVLVLGLALLIWASHKPITSDGTYILWQDTQRSISTSVTIWHLGLNAASTIVLIGSNYTLQVLVAPTREDIDRAHSEKRPLDIGISSLHNWRYICWRRKLLYALLLASTLPVHLLYNSIVFSSAASSQQSVSFVTEDFLQISPDDTSVESAWRSAKNDNQWFKPSIEDCVDTILWGSWPEEYSNVLLFTNLTSSSRYTGGYCILIYLSAGDSADNITFSSDSSLLFHLNSYGGYADSDFDYSKHGLLNCTWTNTSGLPDLATSPSNDIVETITAEYIEYCLIKTAYLSSVELIPQLLVVIIVCSVLIILASSSLLFSHFNPLATIGDAIASFLNAPDPFTKNMGPLSVTDLRKKASTHEFEGDLLSTQGMVWKSRKRYHGSAITPLRWTLTVGFCLSVCLIGGLLLLSKPDPLNNWSVIASSLIVNIPQLALSGLYMCYNALFTCMSLSMEWMGFYKHKKGLRVSRPEGEQRGTYFLSLPYKYAVFLAVKATVLHWLLSQSIGITQTDVYDANGIRIPSEHVHSIDFEQYYIIPILITIGGLLLILMGFALRKFDASMPLARSNSLIISAACHPVTKDEDLVPSEKMSTKKLQYGVIAEIPTGGYRVGFSDKEMSPLVPGEFYR